MSPAPKSKRITPQQHARVREQLTDILKLIAANNLQSSAPLIIALVRKHPAIPEVNHVAATFYARSNEHDKAIYYASRAVEFDPAIPQYQSALGTLFAQAGKNAQAVQYLQAAIDLDPSTPQAQSTLAVAYLQLGRINESRASFEQAIKANPDDHEAIMNLALLESDLANAHQAVTLMKNAIARFPDNPVLHDSLSMFACYDDQLSPQEVFEIHQSFGRCIESRVRTPRSYPNTPDPEKRIRIGFVSPDLREHSIAYFIEPIFEHIDRDRFELFVYSTKSHKDPTSLRLKAHADIYRENMGNIAGIHKQIVNDQIDMLVELTGHFASNLLPVFAAKPAPISVTMVGYANTTGLGSIDARLVDAITDPPPAADAYASEQLVRIDDCFLCYRPSDDLPEIQQTHQSTDDPSPFAFGSFNDLRKISPSTFRTWAAILLKAPNSTLTLKASRFAHQEVQDDIRLRFKALGIDPRRIHLLGKTPTSAEHLSLYNQIDCSLDTFPYTGTTTTCESIAMGVPMLTLIGQSHAGRVSASLLTAINQQELIASTEQEYIDKAIDIASQGPRTVKQRDELRNQLLTSPLVDAKPYTHKIETAMRTLWTSWCQSQRDPS